MLDDNKKMIIRDAFEYLKSMKNRSYSNSQCRYRSEEGSKCVVGYLIKDEFYYKEIEGRYCHNPTVIEAIQRSLGISVDDQFLQCIEYLQFLHDGRRNWNKDGFIYVESMKSQLEEMMS